MPSRSKKLRGSRTHGRGEKAGRGAGKIGGHGGAGLLKHKFMSILKYDPEHFGRRGFKRPQKVVSAQITLNVGDLEEQLDSMMRDGIARKENDLMTVDLNSMGVDKLLGTGHVSTPMQVIVSDTSNSVREKIEAAGGSVLEPQ
ncbi:MAG: uL15m family ribosomal protein [Methanomassiliicoccales archaeon]